ncbi:hypothetical protein PI126_g10531 [Phytophthora idaei]|nr:hypothetical protein PI126_g10531 [Phytophthora idaei]
MASTVSIANAGRRVVSKTPPHSSIERKGGPSILSIKCGDCWKRLPKNHQQCARRQVALGLYKAKQTRRKAPS